MKIYALTTLQRYGIEIQVRLFDTIEQCRKEYNLLIKDFENNKDYIVNKGTEHTEIEYEEGLEILVSIKTYELNDLVNNQVHCVIKGNQECDYIKQLNNFLIYYTNIKKMVMTLEMLKSNTLMKNIKNILVLMIMIMIGDIAKQN